MELSKYLSEGRGRVTEIARGIGRTSSFVSQLGKGRRPVPARWVLAISSLSQGMVQPWEMRPLDWHQLWPQLAHDPNAPPTPGADAANDEGAGEQRVAADDHQQEHTHAA